MSFDPNPLDGPDISWWVHLDSRNTILASSQVYKWTSAQEKEAVASNGSFG